jgi:YHS domain-containing protein
MKMLSLIMSALLFAATPVLAADGNVEDRKYVCMMQDALQVKPGTPIEHEGKTYYGCCQMCADKLRQSPERYTKATDPVTNARVDKASAFIYGLEGNAFYFESKESRERFAKDPARYLSADGPGR